MSQCVSLCLTRKWTCLCALPEGMLWGPWGHLVFPEVPRGLFRGQLAGPWVTALLSTGRSAPEEFPGSGHRGRPSLQAAGPPGLSEPGTGSFSACRSSVSPHRHPWEPVEGGWAPLCSEVKWWCGPWWIGFLHPAGCTPRCLPCVTIKHCTPPFLDQPFISWTGKGNSRLP